MSKLLVVSVIIAAIYLPIRASSDKNPRRGLKRSLYHVFAFNLFYLFAVLYIYPRL